MRLRALARPANYLNMLRRISSGMHSRSRATPDKLAIHDMDRMGRALGRKRFCRGRMAGFQQWLNPISLVRYFEFDFALRHFPNEPERVLDVSSPRLFTLAMAQRLPKCQFMMCNPDAIDVAETREALGLLALSNVDLRKELVDALVESHRGTFDVVVSISVIEHIAGSYDDRGAFPMLLEMLRPGGALIVTIPLSATKQHEDEYYPPGISPYDGTHQVAGDDQRFFFQRLYTAESIRERLLSSVGNADVRLEWWGEKAHGTYDRYRQGPLYNCGGDCSAFLEQFQTFDSYDDMPGMGVCGICVRTRA